MQTFHVTILYKLALLFCFFTISTSIFAQDNIEKTMIIPAQTGTITANSSAITIKLNTQALEALGRLENGTYTVSLIPIGDCGQLRLKSKEKDQFTVALIPTENNTNVGSFSFDYVLFVSGVIKPMQIKIATSIFDE